MVTWTSNFYFTLIVASYRIVLIVSHVDDPRGSKEKPTDLRPFKVHVNVGKLKKRETNILFICCFTFLMGLISRRFPLPTGLGIIGQLNKFDRWEIVQNTFGSVLSAVASVSCKLFCKPQKIIFSTRPASLPFSPHLG